ncbi:MAG TPA: hypothetical protein DD723_10425 [Candidatus Omnitrophica bacterium]|nr:MAG: hypothetical protein A2Z81_06105 [Omnitrophica WOR_2 bacterium GWA2_45_18]OGX19741.1 MAG: hypothetical protein A2Y04_04950 [Omnitrophica WOR_2 bacterium GWC2_45_7]HBR15931.1 hypothetical protein [Candidatus Omnitrophota bacterium]
MLKFLKNKKAQVVMGEYLLVFFLVVGMMTAMTIYFRRSIQARTRDARNYMIDTVKERTQGYYDGNFYYEYEPYYLSTDSGVERTSSTQSELGEGGVFKQTIDETLSVNTKSETAPPKDGADSAYVVYE